MQVLVVEAFILSLLGAFHRVVEHGAVTALLWLILIQRPSQDADAIINAVRLSSSSTGCGRRV